MADGKKKNRKYLEATKDWRVFFSKKQLETAENFVKNGKILAFESNEKAAAAFVGNNRSQAYYPRIWNAPTRYSEDWDEDCFTCSCSVAMPKRDRWGYEGVKKTCTHEAALLLMWEKEHGPWFFRETDEEWEARKKEEAYEAEMKRRQKQKKQEEAQVWSASGWKFSPGNPDQDLFFNIPALVRTFETTLYAIHCAKDYVANKKISFSKDPSIDYGIDGRQVLKCSFDVQDEYEPASLSMIIAPDGIYNRRCNCRRTVFYFGGFSQTLDSVKLCGHELAALDLAWEYVKEHNPGDATNQTAEKLFSILDGKDGFEAQETEPGREKKKVVSITPRLQIQQDSISLSFKIGRTGGKSLILKGFRKLQEAIDEEKTFSVGKSLTLDFAEETINDESSVWLDYIQERIRDADRINHKLDNYGYGYYSRGVSVQNSEKLTGAALDQFYAMTEGQDLDYENKIDGSKGKLHVGEVDFKLRLNGVNLKSSSGKADGLSVTGRLPAVISGVRQKYIVSGQRLGAVSAAQWAAISPFRQIADKEGKISFEIGQGRLAEFYYRVLPGMMENPYIDYEDRTDAAVKELLPPEPEFVFRLDMDDNDRCVAEAEVSYDDNRYVLSHLNKNAAGGYRDQKQEERVVACIEDFFPKYDPDKQMWMSKAGDDAVFAVLDEGIAQLGKYGEVLVTDRISSRPVRSMPSVTIKVSIDGGLLDLSVLSKEVSKEELLQIYNSYRQKRKYHKLKDGSFLNLDGESAFSSIEEVAGELDLSAEDIISMKKSIPMYRALFLDHLLEEHEELVSSRDRTYRALIKNFHTIRDADYDVPGDMEDILRPYQVYGHKWMRTVTEAGFGGILADEMGLGKTLEAISVLESMKQAGSLDKALVVCPASLVYNWEEEIQRFAPGLSVVPVAGTAAVRKKILGEVEAENHADVYITSYDLLRSDISFYKEFRFSIMIIDEAQYIKNQKAAMTKAVKVVRADKRVAMTGTPIENRLAELWSIFDYLMPGFLYDYKTFSEKYEAPITKKKDADATEKLKSMVGPFILRRRKEEVLKDLPPKLEEVRYARLEKEQRKLYDAQVVRMKELLKGGSSKGEDKIRILAELTKIRQICCDPALLFEDYKSESAKREACIELVRNAIGGGHRMLIFSQFTSMLELLEEDLQKEKIQYYKITGATPKAKRLQDVHAFNEGDVPVFLISLKAGGTGLNLTGADMVIHYDPWWNLAAQNQATDRAHRIGQSKTVTVYRLIARDTIEEKILQMQQAKKDLADAILSGEQQSLMSLTDEELLALL